MMKIICINCPRGCELTVEKRGDDVAVEGNACPKGAEYGRAELLNPTRMVTGLVRVAGIRKPLPVKTRTAVPRGKIDDVLQPGANDVYQIKTTDGKTMYLPVLPFVILDVRVKEGIIVVDEERLPEVAVFED